MAHLQNLQDKLSSDPAVTSAFRRDPAAILAAYGIKLAAGDSTAVAAQRGAIVDASGIAPNGISPSGIAPSGISPNGIAPAAGIMPISNSAISHGITPISHAAMNGIRVGA